MTILAAAPATPVSTPAGAPSRTLVDAPAGVPGRRPAWATVGAPASPPTRYCLRVATDPAQVRAAQRLRHQIFTDEFGARLDQGPAAADVDEFDEYGDHLIIEDEDTGTVLGTCRMLPPGRTPGLSSERGFDLNPLAPLRDGLVEAGRFWVHPAHRTDAVVDLVWAGVTRYLHLAGYRWLTGRTSIPLADGGRTAATVWRLARHRHLAPAPWRARPHRPWPVPYAAATEVRAPDAADAPSANAAPPALRGYVRLGAWVCGPPAYDPDLDSADFLALLSMSRANPRHLRDLLGQG